MGKIKQGILGGFHNKVGTVIGSSWKGIAVMRSMPLSVANPKTAAQVSVRGKFSQVVNIAQRELAEVIQPNFNRQAKQMSGYNLFCKLNLDIYKGKTFGEMRSAMVFAKGALSCTSVSASWDSEESRWTINYSTSNIAPKDSATDLVRIVVLDFDSNANGLEDAKITNILDGYETRSEGHKTLYGIAKQAGHTYCAYVYFVSEDGKETSDSVPTLLPLS